MIGTVAACAVVGVIVWGYAGALTSPLAAIDPTDPAQVARGQAVYGQHCAECHGANLEGQPDWRVRQADGTLPAPPHDASGHTWHHDDALLFDYTKRGGQVRMPEGVTSGMPAFGEVLADADIAAVLTYIKSRWPAQVLARQESLNRK